MLIMEYIPEYMLDDPRLSALIKPGVDGKIIIIGFPYDEGVHRNGGRRGSELGPDCMRRFFSKLGSLFNSELNLSLENMTISDYGNIVVQDDQSLEAGHDKLTLKVSTFLRKPQSPALFVVGGGHDLSWAVSRGFLEFCPPCKPLIINIDAHLEVRELNDEGQIHSGCPTKLILNSEQFHNLQGSLVQFASQGSLCGKSHVNFVNNKGGQIVWIRDIRKKTSNSHTTQAGAAFKEILDGANPDTKIYVSFNLTAINSAFCPGVSSPSVEGGLTAEEVVEIALFAGMSDKVVLFAISEYNPAVEDFRTGRLVTSILYHFALGKSTLA